MLASGPDFTLKIETVRPSTQTGSPDESLPVNRCFAREYFSVAVRQAPMRMTKPGMTNVRR